MSSSLLFYIFTLSLYRVAHILTFQVAAKRTTTKLQTKKNDMLEGHNVNINYDMNFFLNNIEWMWTRHSSSLYAVIDVHIVTVWDFLKAQSKLYLRSKSTLKKWKLKKQLFADSWCCFSTIMKGKKVFWTKLLFLNEI